MSRFDELLTSYQDGEAGGAEAEELGRLLDGDEGRRRAFYDAMMLEVDLYESYGGIAQQRAPAPRRRRGFSPAWILAAAVAIFLLVAMFPPAPNPPPTPAAPPPPASPEAPKRREHEKEDRDSEAEREYRKGLQEVERKRREGKPKEAEEKLREIERERSKKLRQREEHHDHE